MILLFEKLFRNEHKLTHEIVCLRQYEEAINWIAAFGKDKWIR